MVASSGFSFTRSIGCDRLMSNAISQRFVPVLQEPEQPIGHAAVTTELHTDGFELHASPMSLPSGENRLPPVLVSTFQLLASIVKRLSGSVRSKSVTSELIRPQPAIMLSP